MRKPQATKPWSNFIDHFRQAHQELRETDATVDELGYHSANAIVEQIVDQLRQEHDTSNPPENNIVPTIEDAPTPPPEQENAVQTQPRINAADDAKHANNAEYHEQYEDWWGKRS